MEASNSPTREQLESVLAQRIQVLYASLLGHQSAEVNCQLLDLRLMVLLEKAITRPEQFLLENSQTKLVHQFRAGLNEIMQLELKSLIESVTLVKVVDLLSATQLETERISFIALLATQPETSPPPNASPNQDRS